jgi:hypothetical protein
VLIEYLKIMATINNLEHIIRYREKKNKILPNKFKGEIK